MLSKVLDGEELLLYLSVAKTAVRAILTRVEGPKHAPVYYISKGLLLAEERTHGKTSPRSSHDN